MPDRLYDAIARSICEPLDGTLFERCAVELLQGAYYPKVRPVDGGNDAGMDGVGELPDGERFFLISTVDEDVRGNLRKNVKSHIDAGGELRTVVLATSREVRGRRRLELQHALQDDFGVRLADVYDRADFVQLLYGNPQWCKDLLGVAGLARALTRLPASRRPTPAIRLIGRDADLAGLRGAAGDLVISGKPGIGKTFVLEKLMEEDWGLFDAGWGIDELEAAIRELAPQRVVLDDAHLRGDRLVELRRLRREMNAQFALIAVSWPGQVEEVAGAIPGASTFVVQELERDQILEVIEEVGIAGPRALQPHLVNQGGRERSMPKELMPTAWAGFDHDEVAEVIHGYYGGAATTNASPQILGVPGLAGGASIELVYGPGKSARRIVSIRPGEQFDEGKWMGCTERVNDALTGQQPTWWQIICYQQYSVDRAWRAAGADFALVPAPATLPRHVGHNSHHPFLLCFTAPGSSDELVNYWRLMRRAQSWLKLLNVYLRGATFFYLPPESHWAFPHGSTQQVWVTKRPDSPLFSGFDVTTLANYQQMQPAAAADYYPAVPEAVGGMMQGPLTIPDDIDTSIIAYNALSADARMRFDLAAHWAYVGDQSSSPSVFFESLCTAVESIVGTESVKCECCAACREYKHATTQKFARFLEDFGAVEGPMAKQVYALRSGITHGRELLEIELPGRTMLGGKRWKQGELRQALLFGVQRGLREWVRQGGPEIAV